MESATDPENLLTPSLELAELCISNKRRSAQLSNFMQSRSGRTHVAPRPHSNPHLLHFLRPGPLAAVSELLLWWGLIKAGGARRSGTYLWPREVY